MEPNYLNPSNIDPARVEPVRSKEYPSKDYIIGPAKHCVTACRTTSITYAKEMYNELFRRMKAGEIIKDAFKPGNSVKPEYIAMITLPGGGEFMHTIEAYGTLETYHREYPQKPTSGLIEEDA